MTCSFPNCHRKRKSKGLCNGHNEQRRLGRKLTPIVPRRGKFESRARDELGRKWCKKCSQWLEESLFADSAARIDGKFFHCRVCERDTQLKLNYGISLEEYHSILDLQNNVCAICGISQDSSSRKFHVDHDHVTGSIRGILCHHCNTGLGAFRDRPESLLSAISYLKAG